MDSLNEIKVLQLGSVDLSTSLTLPQYVKYTFRECLNEKPECRYELIVIDCVPSEQEIEFLLELSDPYRVFVTKRTERTENLKLYIKKKKAFTISVEGLKKLLEDDAHYFFGYSYGEKFSMNQLVPAIDFHGEVSWNGNIEAVFSGDFGEDFGQVAYLKNFLPFPESMVLDIWFEYRTEGNVEIELEIIKNNPYCIDDILKRWVFGEKEIRQRILLENDNTYGTLFFSIKAKGHGTIKIIGLHDRHSRGKYGNFLPGGKRTITREKEEVFSFFDPGDLKPPLIVYFSGYKTKEGFEAYRLFKKMDAPLLLLAEARLEGGAFYMGKTNYEEKIIGIIKETMKELGFKSHQVIMAGLSMGTYGALYYGCDICPHSLIIGKPLVNIGNVAGNERIYRPGGFPTSIDVLLYHTGGLDGKCREALNERFWNKFDRADLTCTKLIVAYMKEDDYDRTGYMSLLEHTGPGARIYGKGLTGRHNDDTNGIVQWFVNQFRSVLQNDFDRDIRF